MKRIIAATLLAAGAFAAAPSFANDVTSAVPAANADRPAARAVSASIPTYGFGNQDITSVIPAVPVLGSEGSAVAVLKAVPFGNADITSVIPELPLAAYASTGAGYVLAHASPFGNADITCTMQ